MTRRTESGPTAMWGPRATVLNLRAMGQPGDARRRSCTDVGTWAGLQPAGPRFKGPLASEPLPREQSLAGGPLGHIFDPARCLTVDGSPSRCPVVPAAPMRRHRRTGDPIHPRQAPNRAAVSLSSEVETSQTRTGPGAPLRRPGEPPPARDTARRRLDTRPARPPRVSSARAPHIRVCVCAGRWLARPGQAGRQAGPERPPPRSRARAQSGRPGLAVVTPPCMPLRARVEAGCRPAGAVRARARRHRAPSGTSTGCRAWVKRNGGRREEDSRAAGGCQC
jgi:hypothetical protein